MVDVGSAKGLTNVTSSHVLNSAFDGFEDGDFSSKFVKLGINHLFDSVELLCLLGSVFIQLVMEG